MTALRHTLLGALALLALLIAPAAYAQSVEIQLDGEVQPGVPTRMNVAVSGLAPAPKPVIQGLEVPGAELRFGGYGRQSYQVNAQVEVVHLFQYLLTVPKEGRYTIPPFTVRQGAKSAESQPVSFEVKPFEGMSVRLVLPQRPLWVGETAEVFIEWYGDARMMDKAPNDRISMGIPLFQRPEIEVRPLEPRADEELVRFRTRGEPLEMGRSTETLEATGDRGELRKVTWRALISPTQAGRLELEPLQLEGGVIVTESRNVGGFRMQQRRSKPFTLKGKPRTLEVRSLPPAPDTFSNLVTESVALEVSADRTVVQVGEPITLTVTLRSPSDMKGLRLPPLEKAGLDPNHFQVLTPNPIGETLSGDEGQGKRFEVQVRVKAAVTSIPKLGVSYFDTAEGRYAVVHSEPVALSVQGGGAPIQNAQPSTPGGEGGGVAATGSAGPAAGGGGSGVSLTGADLELSAPGTTLSPAFRFDAALPWLLALYGLPLLLLGWLMMRQRTAEKRELSSNIRSAHQLLEEVIRENRAAPARDAAPRLRAALTELARALDRSPADADDFMARLDVVAFDPEASERPLDSALFDEAGALAERWLEEGRESDDAGEGAALSAALVVVASAAALLGAPGEAQAVTVDEARAAYQEALAETDRERRTAAFEEATVLLEELTREHPRAPELLTDWGNAAMGAQRLGTATLAYRRALVFDAQHERARRNLEWLRSVQPEWLPTPERRGAVSALFFWNDLFSTPVRHVLAALAFAAFVLLIAPWPMKSSRRRLLRVVAIVPLVLWLWIGASVFVQEDASADAVVMLDGVTLRSADVSGAPPALPSPMPAGAEVRVLEVRGDWVKVELADGQAGWLQKDAVEMVLTGA